MLVLLIFVVMFLLFLNKKPATSETVWAYWHSPIQPKVIRKCIENWSLVGKCTDIRILDDFSVYKWIPVTEMIKIHSLGTRIQHKADLIRLYLLKTYGGIWMDASIILTQKLYSWLPDYGVFCYKADRFSTNEYTCIENYFIKAPPNHPFIIDWYDQCIKDFSDKDYNINNKKYTDIIGKNANYLVPYVSSMKLDLRKYNDLILESSENGPYRDTVKYGWENPENVCRNISYSYRIVKLWNKLREYINPDKIPLVETVTNIPKVLIQTYGDKTKIPKKVFDNIKKFSNGYEHKVFDDKECYNFILENFDIKTANKFLSLVKPAHKADLFRYCYLYINGGIYMDIKTELIKPLDEVFKDDTNLYTVLSIEKGTIYNGILASGPKRHIFLELIEFMVEGPDKPRYLSNCAELYALLYETYDRNLTPGANDNKLYLFDEVCINNKNKLRHGRKYNTDYDYKGCNDGFDRYNQCCYIYDKGVAIIKSRYADFPWN